MELFRMGFFMEKCKDIFRRYLPLGSLEFLGLISHIAITNGFWCFIFAMSLSFFDGDQKLHCDKTTNDFDSWDIRFSKKVGIKWYRTRFIPPS